ncbi:MAG: Ppx/GppA family phosphatase [Synergistaceae bacterium]|jgi:exopolyphosphatase/guanosine-5'-triphosphate,3'-diphosphate pyrophosphatase|nr:Ppx/GppA family phosphatase [Synergistaceae bacterium]
MPIKAVVDVGTNSIKLLVMEGGPLGGTVAFDASRVVRLGEGTDESGVLADGAMERALRVTEEMARRARSLGADEIAAVGTQAMRRARNSGDFVRMVESRCGVSIRVISGGEEAAMSFGAVVSSSPSDAGEICLFDVGGGSSEVVRGSRAGVSFRWSVPVGALSLRDKFFAASVPDEPPRCEDVSAAAGYVRSLIRTELEGRFGGAPGPGCACVGVGGTITTLAAVKLGLEGEDRGALDGTALDAGEVERQIALYASLDSESRAGMIKGLPPERAGIILPGACVTRELMRFCGFGGLTVSGRGLRYGVMEAVFGISLGSPGSSGSR